MTKKQKTTSEENKDSGNIYDRIFRENAQTIFIPLIQFQLDIDITRYEALEFKMSRTREREVDFLYKIFDKNGKESILHLEFQTKNEKEMLARIQEYHALIYRKYQFPIRHIVIYLGKRKSTMKNKLEPNLIFSGFDIINITAIDPNQLISTQIPEMVIMALLGDYKKDQLEKILSDIIRKLKTLTGSKDLMSKYINQLLILARIRNLQMIISQKLDDMPISYDVEKDGLYLKGMEKGIAKSAWNLYNGGCSIQFIAKNLKLSIQQVEEYIKEWEAKS
jgi:hypothetical protein